ncbi:hypothetical protein [uncultured Mucilaginibacter sp.]|uniref:hypothetical protein n=1 Tax=uncultured Mucilaginibacter sp. TaxID=797541 RepID=UPI0025E098AF|nr:hypothetical protein [uncultured Mucilaginibacter sp.]
MSKPTNFNPAGGGTAAILTTRNLNYESDYSPATGSPMAIKMASRKVGPIVRQPVIRTRKVGSRRKKIFMNIDLEAALYAADNVENKFHFNGMPNRREVSFSKSIRYFEQTYYWLPVTEMIKGELLYEKGQPGWLLVQEEFVLPMHHCEPREGGQSDSPIDYSITTTGLAFFHFLLCEAMKARMFYHPEKFTTNR